MSTDVYAIGTALAAKYGAVTQSDATLVGGTAIRSAEFLTSNGAPPMPAIVVELPSGEQVVENTGDQQDTYTFDVYFLLDNASGDIPRAKKALAKWIGPLRAALYTGNQLGGLALKARPISWEFVMFSYGGDEYHAWHLITRVWTQTNAAITP
jgi:hypothetical protein